MFSETDMFLFAAAFRSMPTADNVFAHEFRVAVGISFRADLIQDWMSSAVFSTPLRFLLNSFRRRSA